MIENILRLNIHDFFSVIQTIQIGYKDQFGFLHYESDDDFLDSDYYVSSPEEVIHNNCGWCFDITNLIQLYCDYHHMEHTCFFVEYEDESNYISQIQVFLEYEEKWFFAIDNSLRETFGFIAYPTKEACIQSFIQDFKSYLQYHLKESYQEERIFINELSYTLSPGTDFETCLALIHKKFN